MSSRRVDIDTGRLIDPPTVTIHRSTLLWGSIATVLLWMATVSLAYDAGRTDRAWVVARDAEQRAYEASVRSGR